jgi:hypothetical protein
MVHHPEHRDVEAGPVLGLLQGQRLHLPSRTRPQGLLEWLAA